MKICQIKLSNILQFMVLDWETPRIFVWKRNKMSTYFTFSEKTKSIWNVSLNMACAVSTIWNTWTHVYASFDGYFTFLSWPVLALIIAYDLISHYIIASNC